MNSNGVERKNPIHRNEAFTCGNCKKKVPKSAQGCRNHCPFCLHSKHVDEYTPGDRLSECQGLMEPVGIKQTGQKGWQILFQCLRCGAKKWNMRAPDDNEGKIYRIMEQQNVNNAPYEEKPAKGTPHRQRHR